MFTVSFRRDGKYSKVTFPLHSTAVKWAAAAAKTKDHSNVTVRRTDTPCTDCRSAYACAYAFDPGTSDGTCMMVSQ